MEFPFFARTFRCHSGISADGALLPGEVAGVVGLAELEELPKNSLFGLVLTCAVVLITIWDTGLSEELGEVEDVVEEEEEEDEEEEVPAAEVGRGGEDGLDPEVFRFESPPVAGFGASDESAVAGSDAAIVLRKEISDCRSSSSSSLFSNTSSSFSLFVSFLAISSNSANSCCIVVNSIGSKFS